jgi:hypothetical protein
LTSKDNWKKYPSDMLFARAISRGARRYAPGIFGGSPIYTPDELGADIDEDGNMIVDSVAKEIPEYSETIGPPALKPDKEMEIVTVAAGKMSLESASKVVNRDGVKYVDLDSEKLAHMYNAMVDTLKKDDLSLEDRETCEYKMGAIDVILASR